MFWLGLLLLLSVPLLLAALMYGLHLYLRIRYLYIVVRVFQERPLFIIPRGQPLPDAEDVSFRTRDGMTLRGCYLRPAAPRKGVVLFGLEYGSNRWSAQPYCQHLVQAGYDVFAFEPRNQGDSDSLPNYDPLQWVTDFEVEDSRAALAYLHARPDADPRGVGLFGISKGGGAILLAGINDPLVRCCVTDGIFAVYPVLVPYMRQWFRIYNSDYVFQGLIPSWYYGHIGMIGIRKIEKLRHCRFPNLDRVIGKFKRPLLMIHGEADTYIKPVMAQTIFDKASQPKEFWLVANAKHNQALHVANGEYQRRVLEFFDAHLAGSGAGDQGFLPDASGPRSGSTDTGGEPAPSPAPQHAHP